MQLFNLLPWIGYRFDSGVLNHKANINEQVLGSSLDTHKNYAAYIPSAKAQLQMDEAPLPECGPEELILKNYAVAINPVDWKIQSLGIFNLTYPAILGEDVAGELLEVGSKLKDKFQVGQRVMAHTLGLGNGPAYGGFQLYPVLSPETTSLIPDDMSFVDAAVLPLSVSTAAAGLFMNATLGLEYPESNLKSSKFSGDSKNKPILLLWGGSSSVGSSVIQLASAAGYTVITTASSSNAQYCKDLGAAHVLDYHNSNIIPDLIDLMKGKRVVGAYDAIGSDTTVRQCASVLHAFGGGRIASVGTAPDDLFHGVAVSRISSTNIVTQEPEVAKRVWGDYVPKALKSGDLVPSPKALVVGKGLEYVQDGLDRQKEGVSARKVVVTLF